MTVTTSTGVVAKTNAQPGAVPPRSSLEAGGSPTVGWRHRGVAAGSVVGVAAAYGVVAGLWTPRGPNDTLQALAAMALGFVVGTVAGVVLRSRWAMLLAPFAFIGVFELVRLDASGATVDEITLSTSYGIMASVVGRLFHGILTIWPMMVGVAFGRGWALHRAGAIRPAASFLRRMGAAAGRTALAVSAAVLPVLAVALVRPATTAPILGPDGEPRPGSVAEFATVDIGGDDQTMLIRGHDTTDPVVLFLAGGPGGSELGSMSRYAHPLEQDFVVVTWDQLAPSPLWATATPKTLACSSPAPWRS